MCKQIKKEVLANDKAGKTTLAAAVADRLNSLFPSCYDRPIAASIPMDGFHYTRAHLSSMKEPAMAHHRRGAAFTFDAEAFVRLIESLSKPVTGSSATTVYAPSFDHALKDPVPDSIPISAHTRIVLVEGNYCALDRRPWSDAARLMTELWFVDTPAIVAQARLARRHLASGIVADEVEAWQRACGTDEENARDIRGNRLEVDEVIETIY